MQTEFINTLFHTNSQEEEEEEETFRHTQKHISCDPKSAIIRSVCERYSFVAEEKGRNWTPAHWEKNTFIQDLGRFKMKFCRRQQSYDRERDSWMFSGLFVREKYIFA